ncbi:hypothetical protein [Streptomyces agglomeratus]|uniref:hypothetical protein n=1 Tax=Streptomyces agglomeratus TaxID=285458 RepID=UPI00114CC6EC|nr:hypothetical protein [Streptomyces agglomeratus]
MPDEQRLIVLVDADGVVIAATHALPAESDVFTSLEPLDDQTVHEVDTPPGLSQSPQNEMLLDVLGYRLTADRASLLSREG